MIVLRADTRHHDAECHSDGSGDHEDPGAITIENAPHEPALESEAPLVLAEAQIATQSTYREEENPQL